MTRPQGEVFDIGYRRYDGPREGRWRSRMAVFENGVRTMLGLGRSGRAKILPGLLFLSAIVPALIFVLIIAVSGFEGAAPGPAEYYTIVSLVLLIFGAIMAPELLIPDRRDRVLNLYLVRPLTVEDYLIGRAAAFFVIVLALVYSGQIMLLIGLLLSVAEPLHYLRDHWLDIPRFLASGALIALFITVVPMAVAGFISRRAFAAAFVIGLWFISTAVVGALIAPQCQDTAARESPRGPLRQPDCEAIVGEEAARWVSLADFGSIPMHLNRMIFAQDPDTLDNPTLIAAAKLPDAVPVAWYLLFTVGPALLLWSRYRRVSL